MSIYKHLSYRDAIKERVEDIKKSGNNYNFAALAADIRVQAPYISKVMNGYADFNNDQIFLLTKALKFTEDESRYLRLLVEYERSALKERRDELFENIKLIQNEKLDTTALIETKGFDIQTSNAADYYLDPLHLIVHLHIYIDEYRKDINAIAENLALPIKRVESVINSLLEMGVIGIEKGKYVNLVNNLHLPKSSKLCAPHQLLMRQHTMNHFTNHVENDDDYTLAITFSADKKAVKKIKTKFFEFLKEFDNTLEGAPDRDVFQLNFDLFNWNNN